MTRLHGKALGVPIILAPTARELHRLLSPGYDRTPITDNNDKMRQIYRLCNENCKNYSVMHLAYWTVSELSQASDNMLDCPLNKDEINHMVTTVTTD